MLPFIRQAVRDFTHTGAVWPSSRRLAAEMTRSLGDSQGPRRILEVGPGTGPFTRSVLNQLHEGDEFHLVEINPTFCTHLQQTLLNSFREAHPHIPVTLHESPIEDACLEPGFDHIICGLPFNNFPPELVRSIFRRMMVLLKEGGDLTYFEYAAVRIMKSTISNRTSRSRLKRIDAHGKAMQRQHSGSRELVMANIPPAVAVRLVRS